MDWINVKDRLPNPDQIILAYGICEGEYPEIREAKYEVWDSTGRGGSKGTTFSLLSSGCGCCDGSIENVAYWMPLPEPPNVNT